MLTRILVQRIAGEEIPPEIVADAAGRRRDTTAQIAGPVAVLPLYGPIFPKANIMTEMSGATALSIWIREYEALMGMDEVDAVVLDVDSPGGSVSGLAEAVERMQAVRGQKPVVAVSNHLMASAAYMIGSQADQVVASPSSITGSIGTIAIHEVVARAFTEAGIDVDVVFAGKYKAEANEFVPLSEEARAYIQSLVDAFYGQFVRAVAQGRNVRQGAVRSGYGEGRALVAAEALEVGLVDRVESLDQVVVRLQRPSARRAVARAEHDYVPVEGDDEPPAPQAEEEPPQLDAASVAGAIEAQLEGASHAG